MTAQKCRICGCTDNDCRQCIDRTGEPCYWVEKNLCSACGVDLWRIKPILYSTPMVQALLSKIKRKTRRTKGLERVNQNPDVWKFEKVSQCLDYNTPEFMAEFIGANGDGSWQACFSQYNIGDILWVRETFQHTEILNLHPSDENYGFVYKADAQPWECYEGWRWNPSIFMKKEAARIFLKVTNVRIERLKNITEEEAIAEGCEIEWYDKDRGIKLVSARSAFKELWISIYGEKHWKVNPWIWVYEFEKVERPGNFLN